MRIIILIILGILTISYVHAEIGVTDTEIVLGAHSTESGPMAGFAVMSRAAAAYFDSVNDKGGIHGRKIKYIRIDTQSDPAKSRQAAQKLVEEDKVFAMFFGLGPSHQAVFKYLIEKKVPDMFVGDNLTEYAEPVKRTVFPGFFSIDSEAKATADYVIKHNKGKKVCYLITDNATGEEYQKASRDVFEKFNKNAKETDKFKIGLSEKTDRKAPQANSQVLQLKKDGCEVVFTTTYGGLCPNIISYGAGQNFRPIWVVTNQNTGPTFMELLPEGSKEGVISVTLYGLNESFGLSDWKDYSALMKKNDLPISGGSLVGYGHAQNFVEVLKRTGRDLTRDKMIAAAETLNGYKCGVCIVPALYSPTNHWLLEPSLVITKGGMWRKIE